MALTVSLDYSRAHRISRELFQITGSIAFDTSYAFGGESISDADLKMRDVLDVQFGQSGGYTFEWDKTNNKVKVFQPTPAIVYEEQQTIASNAITLNHPAAYIMCVAQASANVAIVDIDATLGASQCKLTSAMAAGTRTGLTFHSGLSGVVYVTYITQAWKDVWDNLVQSETVTFTGGAGRLAYQALAIQSISTGSVALAILDKDDTVATNEVRVEMSIASALTSMNVLSAVGSAQVTYIKKPTSGFLKDRHIAEEGASLVNSTTHALDFPCLIWGYAGMAPINTLATHRLINFGGTNGTAEGQLRFYKMGGVDGDGTRFTTVAAAAALTGSYVKGLPHEIPGLVPLEVKNGENLAALSAVRFTAVGYK